MTSVRVKFRPSTVEGREGRVYYQVIHDRTVRQVSSVHQRVGRGTIGRYSAGQ